MNNKKFRVWNAIDKTYIDWMTLQGMQRFLVSLMLGREEEHYVLQQYTGREDKNGVEIYEGDIVSSDFYEPEIRELAVIGYDEEEMQFCFNNKFGDLNGEQDAFRYGNLKVIGNIHENPELLK